MLLPLRAVLGTVLVTLFCALTPVWAEAPASAEPSDRMVVAPLNLGVPIAPELEAGVEPVWQALLQHVDAQASRSASLHADSANALWAEVSATFEEGETRDIHTAYRRFALRLAEQVEFSTLVMPVMITRAASLQGIHAHWDGVRRRADLPSDLGQGAMISAGLVGSDVRLRGKIGAASLNVVVLDATGTVLYEGKGGLDLVHELRHNGTRLETALRSDAFRDAKDLREGVEQALSSSVPAAQAR